MEFEFEEKEQYSLKEVQAIVEGFEGEVGETISAKDEVITGLNDKLEDVEELDKQNKELNIKNLIMKNGLDEDVFDLVADDDIEVVESKIEKLQSITKETKIDKSFKPEKKRSDDEYSKAEKEGNVESMISNKLGRLFQ